MKHLPVLFLVVLLNFAAFGQDKFVPGFYVTNANDTVSGFIEYKANYNKGLKFRQQLKSPVTRLKIMEVKAFGFSDGSIYERVDVPLEDFSSSPLFVRVLVKGQLDLLSYKGNLFIGSDKKGRFKLAKGKSSSSTEGLKNYQKNTGIFNILFQDCKVVKDEAQHAKVNMSRLTELLKAYHTCVGASHHDYEARRAARSVRFGFFAGYNNSNLSFGDPIYVRNSEYLGDSNFPSSAQPSFGVMVLFPGREPSGILAIETNLIYTKADFKATSIYTNEDLSGYFIKQTSITTIDYSRLTVNAGLRITGRSNQVNPYVRFGLAYNTFLSMKADVKQTTEINSSIEEEDQKLSITKTSPGFGFGGGFKIKVKGNKALFLDVNYEYSYISYSGKITGLSGRIGFLF